MCDCDIIKINIQNEPSLTLHIKGLTSFLHIVLIVFGILYKGQTSKQWKQAVFSNTTPSPSVSFFIFFEYKVIRSEVLICFVHLCLQ